MPVIAAQALRKPLLELSPFHVPIEETLHQNKAGLQWCEFRSDGALETFQPVVAGDALGSDWGGA